VQLFDSAVYGLLYKIHLPVLQIRQTRCKLDKTLYY
jgi:hypothetical protein